MCKTRGSNPENRSTLFSRNTINNHFNDYMSTADNSTMDRKYSHESSMSRNFSRMPNFQKIDNDQKLKGNDNFENFGNNFLKNNSFGGDGNTAEGFRRRSQRVTRDTEIGQEGLLILKEEDYYKVLGLDTRNVTDREVRNAFKQVSWDIPDIYYSLQGSTIPINPSFLGLGRYI